MRPAAVPPFRTLDPALAAAERLLATGLSTVVYALPDELLAAARLNTVLAGTSPRLTLTRQGWQVIHVAAGGRADELAVAAGGLATLVAVAGWSRLKRCETCAEPFLDRTNGRTRRWCTRHRPNHRPPA
ncbi:MAG TPA: CGNR zinc finger domain-containing protein [Actinophytocola sp.]|jgi:predicted RNA-binding Zn ribbon-like protein|uniref:CGNR zinc finger domain-containing protein n=1 Tax=Actinophytocola sp. TaxID=1872138 RepID=UPI002F9359B3